MKAKDLMIGDCVIATVNLCDENDNETTHRIPCRIEGVSINDDICEGWNWSAHPINPEDAEKFDSFDDLEPIPLTKEIISANGFKYGGYDGMLEHKDHKNLKVYYKIDHFEGSDWIVKYWEVIGIAGIEYVHEFQHYLRLVGFSDFADNFKIKI